MPENALKAIRKDENELRVGNYMVLFGGRDLEGEYFTSNTEFESAYTRSGRLYVDWEHGHDDEPDGHDDVQGGKQPGGRAFGIMGNDESRDGRIGGHANRQYHGFFGR